jgi:hypothetical protein
MSARAQAKKSKKGSQRRDTLKDFWRGGPGPALRYGNDEWRVTAIRPGRQTLDVTDLTERVSWEDNGPMLTGSISLRRPMTHPRLNLGEGHVILLKHRRTGQASWGVVWRMRLGVLPDQATTVGVKDRTYEYNMADEFAFLGQSKSTFKLSKKKHPKGLPVHKVIALICKQEGIAYAPLPTMKHTVKSFSEVNVAVLDMLLKLVRLENTNEDKDYKLRWRAGRLEVIRKQRSPYLLEMADTIIDASLSLSRKEGFATELKVNATPEKGKGKDDKDRRKRKKRKISTTVTRAHLSRRYGRIKRTISVEASSVAEARKKGKRMLARLLRPKKEVSFTHPGIPGLKRHHAVRIDLPEQGIREVAYVQSVSHTVAPGSYEMEVTLRFTDPFADDDKKKKAKKKADAAKKRNRPTPKDDHDDDRKRHPKPKKARQRGDTHDTRTPGQKLSDRGRQ